MAACAGLFPDWQFAENRGSNRIRITIGRGSLHLLADNPKFNSSLLTRRRYNHCRREEQGALRLEDVMGLAARWFAPGAVFSAASLSTSAHPSKAGLYFMLALVLLMTPLWISALRGRRTNREGWAAMIKVFDPGTGTVQAKRVNGGFRGRAAALFYSYIGSKHEYVFFNIEVACSAPLGFSIHQPAAIEKGRAKNAFEIGDPGLDQSFHFSSDDPPQIRSWFLNPEVRSKFVALLYRGSS
jgi:hypothetical protein